MIPELPELPTDETFTNALTDLATRTNGFVYHGDRLETVIRAVKVLRANPDLARTILKGTT